MLLLIHNVQVHQQQAPQVWINLHLTLTFLLCKDKKMLSLL